MADREVDNTGQSNLTRARFFLEKLAEAEDSEPFDRVAVENYLYSAIVFGKATQDWMADRFRPQVDGSQPGAVKRAREEWLASTTLYGDPTCEQFANTRNVVVHEDGSAELFTRTSITISTSAAIMVLASPGQEEEVQRIIAEHEEQAAERLRIQPRGHESRIHFISPDPQISEPPAADVVCSYLAHLEQVFEEHQSESASVSARAL
jgi:hypothetical protein